MKKSIIISNMIRAMFVLMLLMFVFTKNEQLSIRIMIVTFLLLTLCYLAQNLCSLINKQVGVKLFHKLFIIIFLLFGISFLIMWSYAWIKEDKYFPILFTIPFWIFTINIFHKSLLDIKTNSKQTKKKSHFPFRILIPSFLVISILLSGIICLVIGLKDTYHISKKTKNYLITTGYFKDYEIYNASAEDKHDKNKTHITYHLIYAYTIDGQEYTIKTDYGSSSIPSLNSSRKIKYNPSHPNEAILIGTTTNSGLIYFGTFFLLGGMVFVLAFLYVTGVFDKFKINILGLYVGIVFFIVGIGIIAFQVGELTSLKEAIKRMGLWIFIPIMFIIIGCFQIIKCLFFERLEVKKVSIKKH